MDCYILIDDRERAIISLLPPDAAWWRVQRLTYGDYALQIHDADATQRTMVIFERKTYSDFAQSIKDDRIANFSGLIALRAQNPGLRLALLVEGRRPESDEDKIDGIPFKCIRAKMNHLWLRDEFQIIETMNAADTVRRLQEIVHDTASLLRKSPESVSGGLLGESPAPASESPPQVAASSLIEMGATPSACAPASSACVASVATQKKPPVTTEDCVRRIYMQFAGIGSSIAQLLLHERISIAQFVTGIDAHAVPRIARLSMQYRANWTPGCDDYILMAMPHVSREMSRAFVDAFSDGTRSLQRVCTKSRDELMWFQHRGRVHKKVGQSVYECLHFCVPSETNPESI